MKVLLGTKTGLVDGSLNLERLFRTQIELLEEHDIPLYSKYTVLVSCSGFNSNLLGQELSLSKETIQDIVKKKALTVFICSLSEELKLQEIKEMFDTYTGFVGSKNIPLLLLLDDTNPSTFNDFKIKEALGMNVDVFRVTGFRSLVWGLEGFVNCPEHSLYKRIPKFFLSNLKKGLNIEENCSVFMRVRRPEPERWEMFKEVQNLNIPFIGSYNVGSKTTGAYLKSDSGGDWDRCVFFKKGIEPKSFDNRGFSVHEKNYSHIRDKICLEVVCEHYAYITEKTFKPMLLGLPCFYFGYKGMIERLHEIGFKTFDRWWDESYDSLDYGDPKKQTIIAEEVLNFMKKPLEEKKKVLWEMTPVLYHNANLLFKEDDRMRHLQEIIEKNTLLKTQTNKIKLV